MLREQGNQAALRWMCRSMAWWLVMAVLSLGLVAQSQAMSHPVGMLVIGCLLALLLADRGRYQVETAAGWRRVMLKVAVEEMSHLTAVWNISAALGGAPRFGRANFPLDPGLLPAGIVVKLAPFGEPALQHFVHLERPENSDEAK